MPHRRLITALCELLCSAERIVEELDPETFRRIPEPLAKASVGAHLRHCLDTCACLLDGRTEGSVDYGRRERDARLEQDPALALEFSRGLRARLAELAQVDPQEALLVRPEPTGEGPLPAAVQSTLGRELEALRSHTLHHFAMVALFLRQLGVEPGAEFGVAPSTLAHWKETQRCAPLPG